MKEELEKIIKNAYAPYSNYQVAAIAVTKDGNLFRGVNVENASYGATICAERNAINNAITNGYTKGDFKELHLMVNSDKIAYPCFVCRQTISELFDKDVNIYLYTANGQTLKVDYDAIIINPFNEVNL